MVSNGYGRNVDSCRINPFLANGWKHWERFRKESAWCAIRDLPGGWGRGFAIRTD
ncbi:hypothetical protein HCU01_17560 [Halomonas cupida]|uniref:Uncharacterized protein n=1 Tax=Halomonas cupida TaxID=44933 RepID=A0ABQ0WE00_9GAMM|nr:hypothetical protein HCU01_17560 [Halomonas cupida]